ncbi:MAG: GH92 family glycosyl hydrolase [Acidobacteriota bacterium]|nr:GH92 family glycosyl hydrolase [Acidobacteriota bacterium]
MFLYKSLVVIGLFAGLVPAANAAELTTYVNPFIGTGKGAPDFGMGNAGGNTQPGAAFPFGMVLWSPDTTTAAGGYRYAQDKIRGFSLTHFSGRGVACYQDVPFLPLAGAAAITSDQWQSYSQTFQHENESAHPGYYRVLLDSNIQMELTVTRRTGMSRTIFPSGTGTGTIAINAGGSARGNREEGTEIRVAGPREMEGSAASGDCGGFFTYRVFFAIEFDRTFAAAGLWKKASAVADTAVAGANTGAWAQFDTSATPEVLAKVGLSYTSTAEAWKNLQAENPGWDFDAVRAAASEAWEERLHAVQASGGTAEEKAVFYTALYHAFLFPRTFSDASGSYPGFDGQVHSAAPREQYADFAGWDMYRTQMPLMALLAPEASDMMQSLVNDASQDPSGGLPRWEHANTNSGGMIGDSGDAILAAGYALGARHFDTRAALAAMERGANTPGTLSAGQRVRPGLRDYESLGYVSTAQPNSASLTLEYALDDFAISRLAEAVGERDKAAFYRQRAQNWRNLFSNGYIVPRNPDGTFLADPHPWSGEGFCEGSMAQYSLMVPFNMHALFSLMGGREAAIQRLDQHFAVLNDGSWSEHAFMGNEPSLKAPWAYHFAGAPYRTQELVRRILTTLYRNAPGGMPGNDDLGTMSAWAVFAAAGLYPHTPGSGNILVGSPLFPEMKIRLANGAVVEIVARGAAASRPYVTALTVNGQPYRYSWIPYSLLAKGARLEFTLSDTPNREWGAGREWQPPSFDGSAAVAARAFQ